MTDEDKAQRLEDLLKRLHVHQVVFVDDCNLPLVDEGSVYAAIVANEGDAGALQDHFPGLRLAADNVALLSQITARLREMDPAEKSQLERKMAAFEPNAADLQDLFNLKEVIPSTIPLTLMTPDEWVKHRDDLVKACTPEARTLFLFDQELHGDRARHGFTMGTDIIASMAAADRDGFGTRWFCGLLSNQLQKGAEVAHWRSLAEEHQLGLKFFMPIAKANLADPPTFFGAVYRTVINTYCETMKELSKDGLLEALATALDQFDKLDPIDFEHMIVGTSAKEGVSELDTLIRLYGIMQERLVRDRLLNGMTFVPFNDAAKAVKAVADIDRDLPAETKERLLQLQRSELYDATELVNGLHEPLRNGDIFQLAGPDGGVGPEYVLLAQPCDLMVRGDGERGRERDFKIAFLAKVTDLAEDAKLRDELHFELRYFGAEGGKSMTIDFRTATPADLFVLDLAVLQKDGACILNPATIGSAGLRFPARAWDQRVKTLTKHFNRVKTQVEAARKKHGDEAAECLADAILPRAAQSSALKKLGKYEAGAFTYTLKRSGRLRSPVATSALAAFGRYLIRDAKPHDLAQPL